MIKSILTKFLPGIRAQLTFFTAILMAFLIFMVAWFFMRQQNQNLSKKLDDDIKPVLESIKNILQEQKTIELSLGQMEELRARIERQKKSKDYYDQYFNAKVLKSVEKQIKGQLRGKDGKILSDREASAFINRQRRVVLRREVQAQKPTWFGLSSETVKETVSITRVRGARNKRREYTAFVDTVRAESREKLGLFDFDTSKYRAIVYTPVGHNIFDSANLEKNNRSPINQLQLEKGQPLKELALHISEMRKLKKNPIANPEYLYDSNDLNTEALKDYAVLFRNVYDADGVSERAKRILSIVDERSATEDEEILTRYNIFTAREDEIILRLKDVINQLKKRRAQLMQEKPKKAPVLDKEYRELYKSYASIIQEKERITNDLFDRKNKYAEELTKIETNLKNLQERKNVLNSQLTQTKEKIAKEKKSKEPAEKTKNSQTAKSEANKKPIEKNATIEFLEKKLEENKIFTQEALERKKSIEYKAENWVYATEEFSKDAFLYLINGKLQNEIVLKYRFDSEDHRNYLLSSLARSAHQKVWNRMRQWVMRGGSEIKFVFLNKYGRYQFDYVLNNFIKKRGILRKTRSEAEDIMWELDTFPIGQLAAKSLYSENYIGFVRFTADLREYREFSSAEQKRLVINSALVGLLGILLSWGLATLFVARIRKVASTSAEVANDGNLGVRFTAKGWDEISQLKRSLNNMLLELRSSEEVKMQISAASQVQKRMLPSKPPRGFGMLDIGMFYKPMSQIGGDYYNFMPARGAELAFCIGDVSNHGAGPALIMSNLSAQISMLVELGLSDPLKILEKLNSLLYRNIPEDMFVTFFIGFLNPKTGALRYVSAGHIDADIVRSSGEHVVLAGEGLPLGMDDNDFFMDSITQRELTLAPGDLFFHSTDGLVEAKNPERSMYGTKRAREFLQNNFAMKGNELLQNFALDLSNFCEIDLEADSLEDDIAMISIKRKV